MHRSKIEWVLNPDNKTLGWVWNPLTGCLNHVKGLCKGGGFPCYAYKLANGRLKERYLANTNLSPNAKGGVSKLSIDGRVAIEREGDYADPFYPRFWEERLDELISLPEYSGRFSREVSMALREKRRRGIFVCDMGDLFGIGIPEDWTNKVLDAITSCPQHRFYLLTKQPQNLIKFSPFPENCFIGMTLTQSHFSNNARQFLLGVTARVKFLSLEPLLTHMDGWAIGNAITHADWVIIGACTGTVKEMSHLVDKYPHLTPMQWGNKWTAQPRIEWVMEIIEACKKANILYFLKDNLQPLLGDNLVQDMPKGVVIDH